MRERNIYADAINTWGNDAQILKAKEECLEFVLVCLYHEQGRATDSEVIDEAADALITLRQVRLILGPALVDAAIERKLKRLEGTIDAVWAARTGK